MKRAAAPTEVTEEEWLWIAPLLLRVDQPGRPRPHPLRDLRNAICSGVSTGWQWRLLPQWEAAFAAYQIGNRHPPLEIVEDGLQKPQKWCRGPGSDRLARTGWVMRCLNG